MSPSGDEIVRLAPPAEAPAEEWQAFVDEAAALIREHGIVILQDLIPAAVVAAMRQDFTSTYSHYMRPGQLSEPRYQDDPKRAQIPVAPAGALANPLLFANPAIMRLVHHIIGSTAIIGEMGGVISHPGAQPQYTHRDSDFLFGGRTAELELPPPSLTLSVPLVDVPLEQGPTEYWPGTHHDIDPRAVEAVQDVAPRRTPLRAGSVWFYDGRLIHRGGPNHTGIIRPIVYVAYQHPWYLERTGYDTKPELWVTPTMLRHMAPEHRHLFSWALHLHRFYRLDALLLRWSSRLKTRLVGTMLRRSAR